MKIRDFLPVLLLAFVFMITIAVAQEDVIIEDDTTPVEEEVIIEEAPAPAEEEMIEEEIVPQEEEMVEEEAPVEEAPVEEAIVEEPTTFTPGWTAKAYVNFGPIEPWGTTGGSFDMGIKAQLGAQLNIAQWFSLPAVLKPLTAEVMAGYTMFNGKDWAPDYKTTLISFSALGRYDITDLILNLIGFEYPALGIFGIAGIQYNSQSWDIPNREFDSGSSFGLNLGVGVKYNLQSLVGKPVEVDLRFTQGLFITGTVEDSEGNAFSTADPDYSHRENGLLLGIAYPF